MAALIIAGCAKKSIHEDMADVEILEERNDYFALYTKLMKMDKDYRFSDYSLDILKKLAYNSYYLAHKLKTRSWYLEKAYDACSQVIARDYEYALNNGLITLRVKVQYEMFSTNFARFDDPNLDATITLIDEYFKTLQDEYQIKEVKNNPPKNMESTLSKMDASLVQKLELRLVVDIYNKCIQHKVDKRIRDLEKGAEPSLGVLELLEQDPKNSSQLDKIRYARITQYTEIQQNIINKTKDQALVVQTMRDMATLAKTIKSVHYQNLAKELIARFAQRNNQKVITTIPNKKINPPKL